MTRTVGVEEELLLVDERTGAPRAVASSVIADADELEAELQQQQVEIGTRPCLEVAELITELRRWRAVADDSARAVGARVAALATSPMATPPELTRKDRYQRLVEEFGLTAAEQLACGCHVHVGVDSDEEGVAVLDRIRIWLPLLLACSANSPFWQGVDSGYASFRNQAWGRWPVSGPTDVFGDPSRYRALLTELLASGTVLDHGMIYFDARLSEKYPTVEIRVADVCLEVEDAAMIAVISRALVERAAEQWRRGEEPPPVPTSLVRMAMWRAARSGVSGDLLDPHRCRPVPAAQALAGLLEHVRPALSDEEMIMVDERLDVLLHKGTGADRQRGVHARTGNLADVVRDAVEVTRTD